jgi:hypothetical protein
MSSMTGSPRSLADVTLEPLRAKSGWIVALGAVYVIAGIIALGSVVTATKVSVFVVGIMMVIAGVAEIVNAFQIKTWGRFLFWLLLGPLRRCRLPDVRESVSRRGDPDAVPRRRAHRVGRYAYYSRVRHAGGDAVGFGAGVRRHHAAAWPHHCGALAGCQPLRAWHLPRRRSGAGGRELDRYRTWPEKADLEHDPEKACPGSDPGWIPVFRKDHAPLKRQARE